MHYPNGIKRSFPQGTRPAASPQDAYRNRGMNLEDDIHATNQFYLDINKAIIHKKPTPVQIVKVHYPKRSAAVITEGYFQAKSTTDFNGIYRGRHIDFEAKETKNKTLFPLANFHDHQFEHIQKVEEHGGICFAIIRFTVHDETYFVPASLLLAYREAMLAGKRKSIPYDVLQNKGYLIPFKYQARVDYLSIIDQLYFENGGM